MMDFISSSIRLQKIQYEICTFFMHIFKDDEVPILPEFELLCTSCPDENRLKYIISILISAAIDIFASQSIKVIKILIGEKIGLWRTLVVRLCHNHCADKHHLPFEIDIIASRNKLIVESLIFDWPFCNDNLSQLLQYLCDAFHGSNHVNQPYIDDYVAKFKTKYRRSEALKCLVLAIKWVHTVQCSPNYEQTKQILKQNILNVALVSDVIMKNREGQFEEIWNEIVCQLDNFDEFDPSRIDSYPFYCQTNPLLKNISDLIRLLFSEENVTEFSKITNSFHEISERYESLEYWGSDLTNTILAALNTIMIEMVFRKCKMFPKICENNLKMFINAVAVNEPISQMVLMSEVNYWVERLKRKRVEVPINITDYVCDQWNVTTKESIYLNNLEDYFLKILLNESSAVLVPSWTDLVETKLFQKCIITSLKAATSNLSVQNPHSPPVNESKVHLISEIVENMAAYHGIVLQTHFEEKIIRILEKFNSSIFKKKDIISEIDNKNRIIPIVDNIDYRTFVKEIWKLVNLSNMFLKPINIQEYLFDLRHELLSEVPMDQADRIISRIMFFSGWRFRFRPMNVSSSEMFRFHLVFNFLSENINPKPMIDENMSFWMRKLAGIDYSKSLTKSQSLCPFQVEDFFAAPKLDNVKSHVVQVLRGAKNISIPQLGDVVFPAYRKGLDSTKALLLILRTVFGSLNEANCHKHDNVRNWLSHMRALETDLHIICSRLDADRNQVLAELNYLVSFITTESAADEWEMMCRDKFNDRNYRETICLDEDDDNMRPTSGKYAAIKSEKIPFEMNSMELDLKPKSSQSLKRKLIDSEQEDLKVNKLSRNAYYDMNYENEEESDSDYMSKWESRVIEKTTLQSKVNFINSSSEIPIGEMIESRITYTNEPTLKSICIDPGKGKSRPPKYIQISGCPDRFPISIIKKPKLSLNRHQSKSSNTNESKTLYNFNIIREVGNGSFGKIFEAVDKFSNLRVALKRVTLNNTDDGIPQSILREIFLYKSFNHSNIIQFVDIVVNEIESIKSKFSDLEVIVPKSFYFVFEYIEHDLHGLLKSKSMIFSMSQIGFLSKQLFCGLAYIHEKNIIHRDITPSNLMITNRGILKIADFGNARLLTKDVQLDNNLCLTPKTVPFLYRAPEILLEMESYGTEVDVWSAGCVIYEILTGALLWTLEKEQTTESETIYEYIANMAKVLGSPNSAVWPSVNKSKYFIILATRGTAINFARKIDEHMITIPYDAADVLKQIFQWDPSKRITARSALVSNWLTDVEMQAMMPSEFPDKDCHELLFENSNKAALGDKVVDEKQLETEPPHADMNDLYATINTGGNGGGSNHTNSHNNAMNNNCDNISDDISQDMLNNEEEIKDEDLMKFVDSLSGRILELGDVLDRMRIEPVCTPDIVKGVIMRAARVWSETEPIRLRMVTFMLDYLLKAEEKEKLGF